MQNFLKNKSILWGSIGVVVLVIGIVVALMLIPQEQDTRQRAAVQGGPASITVSPATISVAEGETKSAKVSFKTGGKTINTISVRMQYTGTAVFTADDIVVSPQIPSGWSCPLKASTNDASGTVVDVRCDYGSPGGYKAGSATQSLDLFSFSIKGVKAGTAKLAFDKTESTISEVQPAGADTASDILNFPADLNITVTAASGGGDGGDDNTPPATEKKVTLAAPTLSCTASEFALSATVTDGNTKKPNVVVTFKYNSQEKTATTNTEGIATASFTKASSNLSATAEVSGYTAGSTTVTLPTGCNSGSTQPDKRLLMSYDGLSCTNTTFTVTAEAKEDDKLWRDVLVTFKYDGQEKTATTDANGKASVSFPSSTSTLSVTATATDFDNGSISVARPTNCSTTTTTSGAACNQACTASRDCVSGLTCVGGYCRDSRCSSDTSCGCADVDVAAQQGTTELPETGFDQTTTMAILGLLFVLGGGQLFWSFRQQKEQ